MTYWWSWVKTLSAPFLIYVFLLFLSLLFASPLILCLHWWRAARWCINHRCSKVSIWPTPHVSLSTACGLFRVLSGVNSKQAELDSAGPCWTVKGGVKLLTCEHVHVCRGFFSCTEQLFFPCLQHHWHRDPETLESASTQRGGGGGGERGKNPVRDKNSIVLWDEHSAVTSLAWNLTEKNYFVMQLWVWQARAGVCRGTLDPLPISLLLLLIPRNLHPHFLPVSNHCLLFFLLLSHASHCQEQYKLISRVDKWWKKPFVEDRCIKQRQH